MKKEEKRDKTNKGLIILCGMLVIVVAALSGVLGYVLGNNNFNTNSNNKTNTEEKEESKENVIKDIDVLTELSTKIDTILTNSTTNEYEAYKIYGTYNFRYNALKKPLSNEDKQDIVLNSIKWDKLSGEAWKNNQKMKEFCEQYSQYNQDGCQMFVDSSNQLTEEKANNHSMNLFGEKINNPIEVTGKCPMYIYDSTQKMYYKPSPQCGGTSGPDVIHSYKSKFVQKGTEAYVYMSIAHLAAKSGSDNAQVLTLYKDFDLNNDGTITLKESPDEYTFYNPNVNVMTMIDYRNYTEYKFTFKKAKDGSYYFTNIEQTK